MVKKTNSKTVKSEPTLKRLYFDIETSPNIVETWNVGYNLNIDYSNIRTERAIICICYKWEHENVVHYMTWDKGDDNKMVIDFCKVIMEADEVVGHNGDKYDIKFFKTRALYHGVKSLPKIKSIDTLKISKKEFRFNSNRLDYIGSFLGLGRKIKTEYNLWREVIAGNKKALADMVKYCQQDVVLLEKIYKKFEGYTQPKTHIGVLKGGTKCDCPKCGSSKTYSRGNSVTASGTQNKKMQCQNCGSYFTISSATFNKCRES